MHWHALCAVTLEWRWTRVWAKPEDCHSLTCILYHWLTCCLFSSHVCQVSWLQPPCQFDKTFLFIHHSQHIYIYIFFFFLLSANDSVGSVDQLGGNSKLNHPQALRDPKTTLSPKSDTPIAFGEAPKEQWLQWNFFIDFKGAETKHRSLTYRTSTPQPCQQWKQNFGNF